MVLQGCQKSVCHVGRPVSFQDGSVELPPMVEFQHQRSSDSELFPVVDHKSASVPPLSSENP